VKVTELKISGVFVIENFVHFDDRGTFVKTYNKEQFERIIGNFTIKEAYFSISKKDTIRGMHFQLPSAEHAKLVYLISGAVTDVVLDIRKNSPTYGKFELINLKPCSSSVYIPIGCAHGFKALEDNSLMCYNQNSAYDKDKDAGILFSSFGYDWAIEDPILSDRDSSFPSFHNFSSPF
jgi:dTDP-4-dehydrorhamnose 3,5-epimerase